MGRDTIVSAARQLLEKLPPHKATISSIARKAGVDPALVRYYFGSREELLLAVIEDILANLDGQPPSLRGTARGDSSPRTCGDMLDFSRRRALDAAPDDRRVRGVEVARGAAARARAECRRGELLRAAAAFGKALREESHRSAVHARRHHRHVRVLRRGAGDDPAAGARRTSDAEELADRYKDFIVRLVLDGLRRVEPWSVKLPGSA